jgi:alanine-glyoxylate transaminase/serine-glyoxylate transaminase/serine-pyruvate transaminase
MKKMKTPMKLMIPDPTQPAVEVLKVMAEPIVAHYGAEWTEFYKTTTELLKQVFKTQGDVFILNGSGSSGEDACTGSAFSSEETILVGINGFFGERLASISEAYNLNVIPVEVEPGKPLEPGIFAEKLRRNPKISGIAVVPLETSTTIINPVQEIGQIAKKFGVPLMVDAITSLGGINFDMDGWGVDFCASATQKCLGAPPGLSPVAVGKNGWEKIDRNPTKGHGWYLNLQVWRKFATEWGNWHPFPVTMAVNNVAALRKSLEKLIADGVEQRSEHYRKLGIYLRNGLRSLGFLPFTPDEIMAPVVTAAYSPDGIKTSEIVDYLSEVHHIKIGGGLGRQLQNKIIRIAHMSPSLVENDIQEVLDALQQFLVFHDRKTILT